MRRHRTCRQEKGTERPWTAALTPRAQDKRAKKRVGCVGVRHCRQITSFCEEAAGRGRFWGTGIEQEFTTWMRQRREKPSSQVRKSQGERETGEGRVQGLWGPPARGRGAGRARRPRLHRQAAEDRVMLPKRERTT